MDAAPLDWLKDKLADNLNQRNLELDHSEYTADALARTLEEGGKGVRVGNLGLPAVRVEFISILAPDARIVLDDPGQEHNGGTLRDKSVIDDDIFCCFSGDIDGCQSGISNMPM